MTTKNYYSLTQFTKDECRLDRINFICMTNKIACTCLQKLFLK